jgi:hypothetical protein
MRIFDLVFIASVLLTFFLLSRTALLATRGRWSGMRRTAGILTLFLFCYGTVLVATALSMPRRFYAPGERRCFDDWCIAALTAEIATKPASTPCATDEAGRIWIATLKVSSDAKRVRQRALDAAADLEDRNGHRFAPCAAPLSAGSDPPRMLSDELGPGESFRVLLPFRIPADAQPAGLVIRHGAFPGIVIIGDDQSFLHQRALSRVATGD